MSEVRSHSKGLSSHDLDYSLELATLRSFYRFETYNIEFSNGNSIYL